MTPVSTDYVRPLKSPASGPQAEGRQCPAVFLMIFLRWVRPGRPPKLSQNIWWLSPTFDDRRPACTDAPDEVRRRWRFFQRQRCTRVCMITTGLPFSTPYRRAARVSRKETRAGKSIPLLRHLRPHTCSSLLAAHLKGHMTARNVLPDRDHVPEPPGCRKGGAQSAERSPPLSEAALNVTVHSV